MVFFTIRNGFTRLSFVSYHLFSHLYALLSFCFGLASGVLLYICERNVNKIPFRELCDNSPGHAEPEDSYHNRVTRVPCCPFQNKLIIDRDRNAIRLQPVGTSYGAEDCFPPRAASALIFLGQYWDL
jgi:hypothetical protein